MIIERGCDYCHTAGSRRTFRSYKSWLSCFSSFTTCALRYYFSGRQVLRVTYHDECLKFNHYKLHML